MKRVFYFFVCLSVMIVMAISCRHKDPVDDPNKPVDTIPVDTLPNDSIVDTIPVDTGTIPVDTLPVDTTVVDTTKVDTTIIDTTVVDTTDGNIHALYLGYYNGIIRVEETDFFQFDTRVSIHKSDSIEGKYKMYLYQVSFDTQMPVIDIMLDGLSADEQGHIWGNNLIPLWLNAFGTGYDMPFSAYEVVSFDANTYYSTETEKSYYYVTLSIKGLNSSDKDYATEVQYFGESIEE